MDIWRVVMVNDGSPVLETERFFLSRAKAVEEACRQANKLDEKYKYSDCWYDEVSVDEEGEIRIWTEDDCVIRIEEKYLVT